MSRFANDAELAYRGDGLVEELPYDLLEVLELLDLG